ncbi:hypothetical protein TNCV_3004851 [Trichonephila clavipes]|nr:hypothetical protein TNCV_3004851 [Trichonephila clavipes]
MTKLHELDFELLLHPPYNPNLAPSDFFLFSDLKRMLAGQKFRTNEELFRCTVHLEIATEKKHHSARAFHGGIINFRKQVACVKRKAEAGQAYRRGQ